MKRRNSILLFVLTLCLVAVGLFVGKTYYRFTSPCLNIEQSISVYIYPDTNLDMLIEEIKKRSPEADMGLFPMLAEIKGYKHGEDGRVFGTGHYVLSPKDSPRTLLNKFIGRLQTPVKLVVGSKRELLLLNEPIASQLMISEQEVASILKDSDAIYWCLPNTYEVYWNISAKKLKQRLKKEYKDYWNQDRLTLADKIGLTPHEVSILASIVSQETNNVAEMPTVAGLYLNRLRKGIPLQSDPTVKYALGDWEKKRVLTKDTQVDSPFNTYKYLGLPPAPIAMASLQAINAVLHAQKHHYLYMCAKEDFSGTHNFARTLSEHNRNARKYQAALNRLKIYK